MPNNAPQAKPDAKVTWPYTSFKSLLNLFERLEAAKAVPQQIDRSALGGSEGQKTQMLAALKFFGLVGDNGQVSDSFRRIVEQPKERPRLIRELLALNYPEATKLAAVHGTPRQLEETFTGLSGDTLRKAVTFYLHAAKYAQHSTSKFFKVPSGFTAKRRPKSNGSAGAPPPAKDALPQETPSDAKSRYINMLLEKASKSDDLDTSLLDRIEKLLGYPHKEERNA